MTSVKLAEALGDQDVERLALQRPRRPAEQPLRGGVRPRDPLLAVGRDHCVLADGEHPRRQQIAMLPLGMVAQRLRDVAERHRVKGRITGREAPDAHGEAQVRAVARPALQVEVAPLLGVGVLAPTGEPSRDVDALPRVGRKQHRHGPADHLRTRIAEQRLGGRVQEAHLAVRADQQQRLGKTVEHGRLFGARAPPLARLAHRRLRACAARSDGSGALGPRPAARPCVRLSRTRSRRGARCARRCRPPSRAAPSDRRRPGCPPARRARACAA